MKPKNVQNNQLLTVQEQYLRKHKNHHRQVAFLRIFLLGVFLLLWEVSADYRWIDSFFFSSPHSRPVSDTAVDRALSSDAYWHYFIRNHFKFPVSIHDQSSVCHLVVVL